ncbi:MAG: OmpA family protein [Bradymonadales bacterium]|nr:OmpA family protein [Bradymonadales bacterium]
MIQHQHTSCPGWVRRPVSLVAALALVVLGSTTAAQERFDIQQFNPTVSQFTGFFAQPSGRVVESGRLEFGLLINHADDPLVLYDNDLNRTQSLVSAQQTVNLLGVVGIANWLDIGFDLPVILYQSGDSAPLLPGAEAVDASLGLEDIRAVPRLMLVGPRKPMTNQGTALGLLVDTRIPTGDRDRYQGEPFRIEPGLALDIGWQRARLGITASYLVRLEKSVIENAEVDDCLNWGLAAAFTLIEGLQLVPEVRGGVMLLADELDLEELPLEAALGLKWFATPSLLVQAGGGAGLIRGVGIPDFRVFVGMSISPEPDRDRDEDGVTDAEDVCPDTVGTREDGCPDPDRDQDGVCDPWVEEHNLSCTFWSECRSVDICPDLFGDQEDGCPHPDRDEDGVCDPWVGEQDMAQHYAEQCQGIDACPDLPADREDGCPDPDPDADGVCDPWVNEHNLGEQFASICQGIDLCPEVYGEDGEGCPVVVRVTCTAIEIEERIYFETNSHIIDPVSFWLLNKVAEAIEEATWIGRVRIEGHTDNRGGAAFNLDLSQRRAESVLTYLAARGIARERLEAQGFGLTRPIADNDTEEGRALNRRVEFVITEQEECPEQSIVE